MPTITHLSDIWEHTITKILKHDPKSEVGIMIREVVIFNKLEDFNSMLNYTVDDFTPSGNRCYSKDKGEMLHQTPLKELFNLRCHIQHLIDQNGYDYDDYYYLDNPLSEDNWMLQTNWKFTKYLICNGHSMTPKQLNKNPIRPIIKVIPYQKLDKDEGESAKDEVESTTSTEMSEDSISDTYTESAEDSKPIEILKFQQ